MTTVPERLTAALTDRYRIEHELGAGGMATVYLAQDLKHDRQVAIKVLRPELAATLGPQRFLQEIQIAARLTHPHILPLHDSGQADGFLYYVMPYVEGESLRDRLSREGELPVAEAVRILKEVTDALAYAHGRGVVHRDIKPENVMLSGRHALVTDFGVAKALHEATGRQQLTTAGVALGTPAYMAPEQAAADPHMDHRVDLYAVGAMGYELLTGRPPFTGASPQMVLAAQVTELPRPVTDHRPAVPAVMAGTIMRCLEKKPADRWQTAGELLAQLEVLASTPSGGITPTQTQPVTAVTPRETRTSLRRWPVAVAGAAVIAVLAGAGWYLSRQPLALNPDLVAVAPFENLTGSAEHDPLGGDLAERLQEQVARRGVADLVPAATIREIASSGPAASTIRAASIANRTRAGLVVAGTIRTRGDSLAYRAEVLRMPAGTQIGLVTPVLGAAGRPEAVETLAERLAVLLAAHTDWGDEIVWGKEYELPRTLDAYRAFVEAVEAGAHGLTERQAAACERAHAASPEWPMVFRCMPVAPPVLDSVLASYEQRTDLLPGDRDDIAAVRAILVGENERAYQIVQRRLKVAPASYAPWGAGMARATGRHEEAVGYARFLDAATFWNVPSRDDGSLRIQIAYGNHALGRYKEELRLGQDWRQRYPDNPMWAVTFEIQAQAGLGEVAAVEKLVAESETIEPKPGQTDLNMSRAVIAGQELAAHGYPEPAKRMYDRAVTWHAKRVAAGDSSEARLDGWADALLKAGHYEEARNAVALFEARASAGYYRRTAVWYHGLCDARTGDRSGALAAIDRLAPLGSPFDYSDGYSVPYMQATIYIALGETERALVLLREAYTKGDTNLHLQNIWHREPELDAVRNLPAFQQLVTGGDPR